MAAREKRGKGVCRRVQDDSIAPTNWHGFLRLDQNKTELFCYLSQSLVTNHDQTTLQLICTFDIVSISSDSDADLSFASPSTHKEADI